MTFSSKPVTADTLLLCFKFCQFAAVALAKAPATQGKQDLVAPHPRRNQISFIK